MKYVLLQHDPRVSPPNPQSLSVSSDVKEFAGLTVAFRRIDGVNPVNTLGGLNATHRMLHDWGNRIYLPYFETDSTLAPLFLWDIAHKLPLGGSLHFLASDVQSPFLARGYFQNHFARTVENGRVVFEKTSLLPAEKEVGLDQWTFGIPTGPGDATGLNCVVKRILELGYQQYEILLCGRPGDNFKYFDKVRIVGEEYSKPPIKIGLKKNVLAEQAKYNNLCLLHDRVFLPKDFKSAIEKFGDLFPITSLQSMWVDDKYNTCIRRYSDYGIVKNAWSMNTSGNTEEKFNFQHAYFKYDAFGLQDGLSIYYASPCRFTPNAHCTGSLYICKKSVWLAQPQSSDLLWEEFEDIEHSHQTYRIGIPSRMNPYSMTQSIYPRASLIDDHIGFEKADGSIMFTSPFSQYTSIAKKPLVKMSEKTVLENMGKFVKKYTDTVLDKVLADSKLQLPFDTRAWLNAVCRLLYCAKIPFHLKGLDQFFDDYSGWLLPVKYNLNMKRRLIDMFCREGPAARVHLFEHNYYLFQMALFRPKTDAFYKSIKDFHPKMSATLRTASWVSASRLAKHNGEIFYIPEPSTSNYYDILMNSTPFEEYCE
jgi:hypothetical protein